MDEAMKKVLSENSEHLRTYWALRLSGLDVDKLYAEFLEERTATLNRYKAWKSQRQQKNRPQ